MFEHYVSSCSNVVLSRSAAAYIRSNQIMGWGEKAIEIRSVETGHLDGVFMHKRAQRLKFLCERNDKVRMVFVVVVALPLSFLPINTYFPLFLCSAGLLCLCAPRRCQPGVLHDPGALLPDELVDDAADEPLSLRSG